MHVTRKKFVFLFLGCGFTLHFAAKLLLDQPPDALWALPSQEPWQRNISTVLAPLRVVLVGPINWLMQDPDPPPPFRIILSAAYWSLLAMGIYWLLAWIGRARRPA